jgi:hypothetical protein
MQRGRERGEGGERAHLPILKPKYYSSSNTTEYYIFMTKTSGIMVPPFLPVLSQMKPNHFDKPIYLTCIYKILPSFTVSPTLVF